jgi:type II secretory pathway component PulF
MDESKLPVPSNSSPLLRSAGILSAHSLALFFVFVAMVKIVPTFAYVFEAFELELPEVTRRIVLCSEFCVSYWFLIFPSVMVADAIIVLILAFAASRRSWVLSVYSHLCLLAASAVLVYVAAWLSHPVYSMAREAIAP